VAKSTWHLTDRLFFGLATSLSWSPPTAMPWKEPAGCYSKVHLAMFLFITSLYFCKKLNMMKRLFPLLLLAILLPACQSNVQTVWLDEMDISKMETGWGDIGINQSVEGIP
jgi:hypothetical protein